MGFEKIKKYGILGLIIIVVLGFLGTAIYFGTIKNIKGDKNDKDSNVDTSIPPDDGPSEYVKTSNKSWSNCAWISKINKDDIKSIAIVQTRKNGSVVAAWSFDGLNCFLYDGGLVEIVVGKGVKILGPFSEAFKGLINVESITGLGLLDVSLVTNINGLFEDCISLKTVDFKNMNTESVLMAERIFKNCGAMENLDMGDMNFRSVVSMNEIFSGCVEMCEMILPKTRDVETMDYAFFQVGLSSYAKTVVKRTMSTEKCRSMSHMFAETSFYDYQVAQNLKTDSLEVADHMFYRATARSLDLSKWNTAKLKDAHRMFYCAYSVREITMDGWNVESLENTQRMFSMCDNLELLTINWTNANNIKNAESMFDTSVSLIYLDITGLNGAKIENATKMFYRCSDLETIICDGFEIETSNNMFSLCESLVGAVPYSKDRVDGTMANTNGYFKTGE